MFALKALVMSLLNVARAGEWRRAWWVTSVRAVVAFLPPFALAWFLGSLLPSRFDVAETMAVLFLWLSIPVVAYLILGGIFVDHLVSRIGALMTWVVHLLWFEVVVATLVLVASVLWLFGIGSPSTWGTAALLTATVGLLQLTFSFVLARLVPGSFPTAKPWNENVNDIEEAYRKLRGKIEDRKRADAPRAIVPPPRKPKPEKVRKPKRLKRSDSPPAELPPPRH